MYVGDVPFFIRTPTTDGRFLVRGIPPKYESFGFFSSKGADKNLRGRIPAIFS